MRTQNYYIDIATFQNKNKIKGSEKYKVKVLPKSVPTTKHCPNCGKLNKEITLADRTFKCSCGYEKDRDIHAASMS